MFIFKNYNCQCPCLWYILKEKFLLKSFNVGALHSVVIHGVRKFGIIIKSYEQKI